MNVLPVRAHVLRGLGNRPLTAEVIYLQAVIDTYVSYSFGKLYTSKLPETAADILYDKVLSFYEEHKFKVEHVLTDNGREYCGKPMVHPYQIFLELYDIGHRRTKVVTPRTNGFVKRFNRNILDEFFRETFRTKLHICPLKSSRQTWTNGSLITTTNGPTGAIAIWGEGPLRLSKRGRK